MVAPGCRAGTWRTWGVSHSVPKPTWVLAGRCTPPPPALACHPPRPHRASLALPLCQKLRLGSRGRNQVYLEVSAARVGQGDAGHHVLQEAHALVRVVGAGGGQGGGAQRLHHWDAPGGGGGGAKSHTRAAASGAASGCRRPQRELWPQCSPSEAPVSLPPQDVCHSEICLERFEERLPMWTPGPSVAGTRLGAFGQLTSWHPRGFQTSLRCSKIGLENRSHDVE